MNKRNQEPLTPRFRAARGDPSLVVIEGLHALKHALRFGAIIELAVTGDAAALARLTAVLAPDLAPRIAALVCEIDPERFTALAPLPPATGVMALARRPQLDALGLFHRRARCTAGAAAATKRSGQYWRRCRAGRRGRRCRGRPYYRPPRPMAPHRAARFRRSALRPARRTHRRPGRRRRVHSSRSTPAVISCARALPDGAILAFGSERSGLDADLLDRATLHRHSHAGGRLQPEPRDGGRRHALRRRLARPSVTTKPQMPGDLLCICVIAMQRGHVPYARVPIL